MRQLLVICICFLVLATGCASVVGQLKQDPYAVVTYGSTEDTTIFIKYSTTTGQAWILADEWQPISDNETLPESKYVIKVVSMPGRIFTAVRFDTISGRSWTAINNRWAELKTKQE